MTALTSRSIAHGSQLCGQQGAFFRLLQEIVESPRGLRDCNCIRSLFLTLRLHPFSFVGRLASQPGNDQEIHCRHVRVQ